ncbi:TPA: hypothetical protein DCX15_03570 [bacterium]|nr:hypothetical protein [bacterium]
MKKGLGKIKIGAIILSLCLSFLLSGCTGGAREYYDQADKFSRSKAPEDWERAIKEYQKIIDLKVEAHGRIAYIHRKLGDLFLEREMFSKAEEHYLLALELLPNIPELRYSLGITYANLGITEEVYLDKAITEYENAIKLNPKFAKPYYGMGLIYFYKKGMLETGILNMKRAIELGPDYIDAYVALGRMYYEAGNYQGAIDTYERVIAKHPRKMKILSTYYNNIGLSYLAMGDKEKAVSSFKQALKIDPRHTGAKTNLKEMGTGD